MKRLKEQINHYVGLFIKPKQTLSDKSKLILEQYIYLNGKRHKMKVAHPSDAPILVELQKLCYSHDAIWSEELLFNEMSYHSNCLYLIMYDRDLPIAFIGSWIKGDECHVSNIVTMPSYQRQGIGYYLLSQVERIARMNGCQYYTLEVRVSNIKAQRLYKTYGFKPVGYKTRYYSNDLEDAVDMTKRLNE